MSSEQFAEECRDAEFDEALRGKQISSGMPGSAAIRCDVIVR
jgi:hypothetical protein